MVPRFIDKRSKHCGTTRVRRALGCYRHVMGKSASLLPAVGNRKVFFSSRLWPGEAEPHQNNLLPS